MRLRTYDPADADLVIALNQGALDAVTPLDRTGLDRLVDQAEEVTIVETDGSEGCSTVAGFAVVLAPGRAYASRNYAWFGERYRDFHYLDRIVVAPAHRRRGVGTLLYQHLEEAAQLAGRLTCEVYSEPPNVGSLAFHAARGYLDVGRLEQLGGTVCTMFAKELSPAR